MPIRVVEQPPEGVHICNLPDANSGLCGADVIDDFTVRHGTLVECTDCGTRYRWHDRIGWQQLATRSP